LRARESEDEMQEGCRGRKGQDEENEGQEEVVLVGVEEMESRK
jgi:hypothetical protein